MRADAPSQTNSMDYLIEQFKLAQDDAVQRFDNLIEAAGRIQDQRNLFEEIIQNSSDGVFVVDGESGIITHVNEGGCRLLDLSLEEVQGTRQIQHFPKDLHGELKAAFGKVVTDGGLKNLRSRMLRADGSEVHVDISANALPDQFEGQVVGFVRDVSAMVKAEEELKTLNEELEERVAERTDEIRQANKKLEDAMAQAQEKADAAHQANQDKGHFLANMTHEIRTPLNAVAGLVDLLLDMKLDREARDTAEIISRSANTLSTLINDILDYSKMEAGKLELEKTVFDLQDQLSGTIEPFLHQAMEKNLELKLDLADDLPDFVIGDPGRLRQVLVNLLGNALKFTASGSITVSVRKQSRRGRRYSLRFAVQDTGIGIARQFQKEMFAAFTQAESATARKFGGTGLGLNISSRLVQKMGGKLDVESAEGEGSKFHFVAHFGKPSRQQIKDTQKTEDRSQNLAQLKELNPENLNVLLVEDNKLNQRVAQGMMAKLGFKTHLADNGLEALEQLKQQKFDLVFMDLQMPEMDGLETAGSIRRGSGGNENRQVPIIAMTAHASRSDRKNCLAAGMNDYIAKPISSGLICQAVLRVMNPVDGQDSDKPSFSMKRLREAAQGDVSIAAEVMDDFMVESRRQLNLVIGALQNFDFEFATTEAQSLQAGARKVHATSIVEIIDELAKAVGQRDQDSALNLADDIRAELGHMESVI